MIRSDYKKKFGATPSGGSSGSVRGFLSGLATGLAVAASVHVYHKLITSPETLSVSPPITDMPTAAVEPPPLELGISDRDLNNILLYDSTVTLPDWKIEYILQAQSYRTQDEARLLKQKVLNLGYKSTVRKIVEEGETWYRIEIGPYHEIKDVSEAHAHLKRYRVETIVKQQKAQ